VISKPHIDAELISLIRCHVDLRGNERPQIAKLSEPIALVVDDEPLILMDTPTWWRRGMPRQSVERPPALECLQ
jgi:hypothetical protein